ncbi:MAG: hypothetical protein JWM41_73 [Gemmatimonadetes bacterium]|nr:hypothetical protein [Gemmatimonadota bacterium]
MTDTASFVEHACTLAAAGWEIPAALSLPAPHDTAMPLASAVLLVPGSLFSDVNGDYPAWNSFPHVYAHLAQQLSARGHAVYRFAKLGPGTGSVPVDAERSAMVKTWDGRRLIAAAALEAMRRELASRGVQVARTIGAGHSEGAVVVSGVATSALGAGLDGVVLLAGPSVGILQIMREQAHLSTPPEQLDDAKRKLDDVIGYLRRDEPIPAELAQGGGMGAAALASMPEEARRYMRDSDATDPRALAARLTQPVLVVQGGNDTSVPAHHGEALVETLLGRERGDSRTEYLFVPGVTHMFKVVPAGLTGQEEFGYPGATDARVAEGIDRWIRKL